MEELSFVPSAVSEPRWALHMCDNKCSIEGFKFYQLAVIVTEEGGASRSINLCKPCYIVMRLKGGEREVIEEKAIQRSNLCEECGKISPPKKLWPDQSW